MAGMMRRLCVVVILSCAWQVCIAEKLVNLVEPMLSATAPLVEHAPFSLWKMFDHDKSTYQRVPRSSPGWTRASLSTQTGFAISPTKYRITMPAHVPPKDYPSSWYVWGTGGPERGYVDLGEVEGAVFKNGVYEGALPDVKRIRYFQFDFNINRLEIAEIELLGPRSRLNELWPYGKYPCSQRLRAIPGTQSGPKDIFVSPKNAVVGSPNLRNVFNARADWDSQTKFSTKGGKVILIGAVFPEPTTVHEVAFDNLEYYYGNTGWSESGIARVYLEGSFCQPNCRESRWVRLGQKWAIKQRADIERILVKNPDKYRAYRLKFVPKSRNVKKQNLFLSGITFLGCTA